MVSRTVRAYQILQIKELEIFVFGCINRMIKGAGLGLNGIQFQYHLALVHQTNRLSAIEKIDSCFMPMLPFLSGILRMTLLNGLMLVSCPHLHCSLKYDSRRIKLIAL